MIVNPHRLQTDTERRLEATRADRREAIAVAIWWVIIFSGLIWFCIGCSTVTPDRVERREASFDGNERTSGILESTPAGYVVTDHFRERYNGLIETYGRDFTPELRQDSGIRPVGEGRWLLTKQHMVHFLTMNAWRNARLEPAK